MMVKVNDNRHAIADHHDVPETPPAYIAPVIDPGREALLLKEIDRLRAMAFPVPVAPSAPSIEALEEGTDGQPD
jgi:hypothetical protein